ncbi:hypothetical protein J2Z48_000202 [Croceifilum oryzae]|uniref:Uncharacterized protein n=1 Tax=Croceifilum oryzae TaxID=1553429 RepID=A0AAJ1TH68_9BACL|nr:hypothetical protein [Croceifilum oryzae]MDQ0416044.1 hypothetical protein [Croceifilum oryzae]
MNLPTDAIGIANPLLIANPLIIIVGDVGNPLIVIVAGTVNLPTIAVETAMNLLPAVQKIHVMIAKPKGLSYEGLFPFEDKIKKPPYVYGASHKYMISE